MPSMDGILKNGSYLAMPYRKQLPGTFPTPFRIRIPFLQPMSQGYGHIVACSLLFLNETSSLVL